MLLEAEDLKPYIPLIISEVRRELAEDRFLSYPDGLIAYLYGNEPGFEDRISNPSDRTYYYRVNKLWSKPDFPRLDRNGVRGVSASDLKDYLKSPK